MSEFAAARRRVDRLLRNAKQYPIAKLETREARTIKNYEEYLAKGKVRSAISFINSLALGMPNLAEYNVLNGEEALGWQQFERYWYLRSITQWALGPDTASSAPCLLAHAIVRGDTEIAGHLAPLVKRRLEQSPADWGGLGFPAFSLGLYARWTGSGTFERVTGVFADVVSNWNAEGLSTALDTVCDHHLDAAFDDEGITNEFLSYQAIPIELLAIRAVREREGLSTPASRHPLANTLLAQMPFGAAGYDPTTDPWVERVQVAAAREDLIPADWRPQKPI